MEIKYPEIYDESYKILKSVYGDDADFRDGQYEAIEATMTNKRTLVVQRTGWGKSLVYFMCTKMFRRMKRGFTMVISPLLVLMENQAEMAKKLGISPKGVEWQISKLKADGSIRRIGPDNGGHWEVMM